MRVRRHPTIGRTPGFADGRMKDIPGRFEASQREYPVLNGSLVSNPDLISKVYIPRLLVPGAAVLASPVDFAIAFALLIGLTT